MNKSHKNILVIAAHPDDEVLGCGGAISRYASEGDNCHIIIMAEGVTSRDDMRDIVIRGSELNILKEQANRAAALLGAKGVEFYSFPDNRMDSVDFLDVVKAVEAAIGRFNPDVIFTHHYGDLNIDHQITARAVETATRPMQGRIIPEVYSFEVLSSTEWTFSNNSFHPNCFVDISTTLERKIEAFNIYTSEVRKFPHPRSAEAIHALAHLRGLQVGFAAAEAFHLVRKIV